MFKIHKLTLIPLLVLFSSLLIIPLYAENQQKLDITWTWVDGRTFHQERPISCSIIVAKTDPNLSVKVTSIWLHTSWMEPNVFIIGNFDLDLKTGENSFNFTWVVPSTAVLGETADFACIVKYKMPDGTEFDSPITRAPSVTIKRGLTIYSEPIINPSVVGNIGFFFFVSLGCVYLFRKNIKTFPVCKHKYIPVILFVTVFFVYVLSVHWNFIGYLVSDVAQQGFLITGDEPHYVFLTKVLLKGNLDLCNVYPEGTLIHGIVGNGLFTKGIFVSVHGIGIPFLSLIPYIVGEFFTGSGVYGMLVLNCLFASGIILLIYKITVKLSEDIFMSLITALTFAFSTLLFPWAGQIFPEIAVGFCLLLISYKILIEPTKNDWIFIGILLGLFPFLKHQVLVLSFLSLFLISVYLFKKRRLGELKYLLPSFGISFVLYIFYIIAFLGFEKLGLRMVPADGGVSAPPSLSFFEYNFSMSKYFWLGLLGHWIDSNSGLLFYSPILILSFLGIVPFIRKAKKFFVIFVLTIFGVWYLSTGILIIWHGWLSIPARYMICILPLLSIPFVFALKEFSKNILFRLSFVILFLFGLISSGFIAFNRVLGFTFVWVQGIPRSRYVLAIAKAFKVDIYPLPDFAYAWYKGGGIGNVPQSSILLAGWSIGFLIIVILLLYIGYKGDNFNITEKIKQRIGKYHEKDS